MKNAALILVSALSLVACGSSAEGNGNDAGNHDAGNNDAGNNDAGNADAGSDGGPGDLHVTWTVDGVDADHATHCTANNVEWFAAKIAPAAPDGGSAVNVVCATSAWNAGNAFTQLPPGTYSVTLEAHATPCCTGVATASTTKSAVVTSGGSTTSTFDYKASGY